MPPPHRIDNAGGILPVEAEIVKNTFSQSWLLSRHFWEKKVLVLDTCGKVSFAFTEDTLWQTCCHDRVSVLPDGSEPRETPFRGHLIGIEVSLVYSLIFLRKSQTD